MNTDRELLELAAKAAGLQFATNGDGLPGYVVASNGDWRYGWGYWNPLTDDGHALRLAIKVGLAVVPYVADVAALHNASGRSWAEPRGKDTYAAARRAIVRAAAEIGKDAE